MAKTTIQIICLSFMARPRALIVRRAGPGSKGRGLAVRAFAQWADGLLQRSVRRQQIPEDFPGERNCVFREDCADELLNFGTALV